MIGQQIKLIFLTIFILGCLTNCSVDIAQNTRLKESTNFFSTIDFFQQEQKRLMETSGFTKTVNFNGQKEKMALDSLDFEQEFAPFRNSDINKIVWLDKYQCDTITQTQQIQKISCQCMDEKLKTQFLEINYVDGEISSIFIENIMNKMLLETKEYLSYTKDESYEFKRMQRLRTGGLDSTYVQVIFN